MGLASIFNLLGQKDTGFLDPPVTFGFDVLAEAGASDVFHDQVDLPIFC
jgi:hypothetical protein